MLPLLKRIYRAIVTSVGRCFLHELTHLDYFMETPPISTTNEAVWDWKITTRTTKSKTRTDDVYGPFWTKAMALYKSQTFPFGQLPSKSADNLAMYALARYVRNQIGECVPIEFLDY
jgi:hypothetical protein